MMRPQVVSQAWPAGPASPPLGAARVIAHDLVKRLRNPDLAIPLTIALGARLVVMLVATTLLRLVIGERHIGLAGVWDRRDANWYLAIARYGYNYSPIAESRANFFPLYPMLIAVFGRLASAMGLPQPYTMVGMAISWVTFIAAMVALYRLALRFFDRRVAMGAVTLLAVFPFSFYYGAVFTESAYLICVAIAFLAVERRNWWLAAGVSGLASALRPPGLILGACVGLAYLILYLRERRWLRWDLLALALIPTGGLAYSLYCWIAFGDPLAYVKTSQAGWHEKLQITGIHFAWKLLKSRSTWSIISQPKAWIEPVHLHLTSDIAYMALAFVFLLMIPVVWKQMGPIYAIFLTVSMMTPVLEFPNLNSLGRYLSVLFPAFFALAWLLRRWPPLLYGLAALSLTVLCVYATFFIAGFGLP